MTGESDFFYILRKLASYKLTDLKDNKQVLTEVAKKAFETVIEACQGTYRDYIKRFYVPTEFNADGFGKLFLKPDYSSLLLELKAFNGRTLFDLIVAELLPKNFDGMEKDKVIDHYVDRLCQCLPDALQVNADDQIAEYFKERYLPQDKGLTQKEVVLHFGGIAEDNLKAEPNLVVREILQRSVNTIYNLIQEDDHRVGLGLLGIHLYNSIYEREKPAK